MPPAAAIFRLPDPAGRLAGVRLAPDAPVAGPLTFRREGAAWELTITRPPVRRMEYLLELRYPGGYTETVPDPANPLRAPGAFGPKSVREFPGYAPPGWLTAPAKDGKTDTFELAAAGLEVPVSVRAWSPAGATAAEALPLLVVHDGPEYDELASLTRYLSAGITGGWLPRLRAALLGPGPRDRWYSANSRYARALCRSVIPALTERLPATLVAGMGTSLGACAMLHAHYRHPGTFGALFLQSGSFFTARFDSHMREFRYYHRIVSFVEGVSAGSARSQPVPVAMTCGMIEENAPGNRLVAAALRAHSYQATLDEVPDMHNYTAWRDAFDPGLTRLLRQACP